LCALRPAQPRSTVQGVVHSFIDMVLDMFSACRVWLTVLVTLETALVVCISVFSVLFYTRWYEDHGAPVAANLNWTFVSFALVFPLTFSLNEAFRRRELALQLLATMKACSLAMLHAHRDWDWPAKGLTSGGRAQLPEGHVEEVRSLLLTLNESQAALLLTPNVGRARHARREKEEGDRARFPGRDVAADRRHVLSPQRGGGGCQHGRLCGTSSATARLSPPAVRHSQP
jgi:hypothetical protein